MGLALHSPGMFVAGMVAAALVVGVMSYRRIGIRGSSALIALAAIAFAAAIGGLVVNWRIAPKVAVMVDVSASTRGAAYRDETALKRRIGELIGNLPFALVRFGEHDERTRWSPASADAIILFSDGQFDLPAVAPVTYPVLDPNLDQPADASIVDLEFRSNDEIAILTHNAGPSRRIALSGAIPATLSVPTGDVMLTAHVQRNAGVITARLSSSPQDLWPENDVLSIPHPPAEQLERWWVGASVPDSSWRAFAPANLSTNAAAYLQSSVIVLNDISALALSAAQSDRLMEYARDLGGGVIVLGGPHAYSSGGYSGTALDALSPLASNPPRPVTRWVILVDASGSMASPVDSSTKFAMAARAVAAIISALPSEDPVSIGSFAKDLRWWVQAEHARGIDARTLPPAAVRPTGPTNLQPALEQIVRGNSALPTAVVVITDADVQIADAGALAARLKANHTSVHLLALRDVPAENPLRKLVSETGGRYFPQPNPNDWLKALRELFIAAAPDPYRTKPVVIKFAGPLASLGNRNLSSWNMTWPKERSMLLASATVDTSTVPLIGMWNVGEGRVIGTAYQPDNQTLGKLVDLVPTPPRDPRFMVSWSTFPDLRVYIDATDGNAVLNNFTFQLISPGSGSAPQAIPQTGPGRYALQIAPVRTPTIFTISHGGKLIDRRAIPGRYATEFDRIGTNVKNLNELARRTGGAVITPAQKSRLALPWKIEHRSLTALMSILGGLLIAIALLLQRSSR